MSDGQTQKLALGIEYDGSRYYGWQRQNEVRSVQEKVERALSKVADHPVSIFCAGRTDAGVHGTGQVVHFETTSQRPSPARVGESVSAGCAGCSTTRSEKDGKRFSKITTS